MLNIIDIQSAKNNRYDLMVMGGGASGLMAAVVASREGKKVLIVESNAELGKKLKITGGGRCNIFNAEYDTKELLAHYGKYKKFLYTSFDAFGVAQTEKFFKSIGIEVKIEDKKRAFPISEKALDVYKALEGELIKNKVDVLINTKVANINSKKLLDNKQEIASISVENKCLTEELMADKYIISTGGQSHPETGSTGDGFKLLKNLRLKVKDSTPGLVPLKSEAKFLQKSSGKTFKDVKITFFVDGIKKKTIVNKNKLERDLDVNVLCTHFGVSGPAIISASSHVREWLTEGEVVMSLDLFKDKDEKLLDEFLLQIFDRNKNRKLRNILNVIYPYQSLEPIFEDGSTDLQDINLDKEVNDIKKEERKRIGKTLKNIKIKIDGLMGYDKAIVADGGLEAEEVDFKNMSIRLIENLHVTGDILNITRPSGGYSLQLCWTTGYLAGRS